MGDIFCKVCGEPWDAYGVYHGDMTEEEKEKFLRGQGCPCCKGKKKDDSRNAERERNFLRTLTEETDEDPIELLDRALMPE